MLADLLLDISGYIHDIEHMATTEQGKAISSMNATRHGILAETSVLPDESQTEFDAFVEGLCADLRPSGGLQASLFQLIAGKLWRLRRLHRAEAEVLNDKWIGFGEQGIGVAVSASRNTLELCSRYEQTIEKGLLRLLAEYRTVQGGGSFGEN